MSSTGPIPDEPRLEPGETLLTSVWSVSRATS
jgi:hypothetical protein